MRILLAIIKDKDVIMIFDVNGWDRKNKDPKVLFNLIQSCIVRIINEVRIEVLGAYLIINCAKFDSINSFFRQYTRLCKCITDAKYAFTDDIEVGYFYWAVKDIYLVDARYWFRDIEDKKMITGIFLSKFSNIAISESSLTNLNVNITKIQSGSNGGFNGGSNNGNNSKDKNKDNNKKIKCFYCNKKIFSN